MIPSRKKLMAGLALSAAALPALAHTGHEAYQMSALLSGFAHPFTGVDHLLAMLAVGFVAAQMKQAVVKLSLSFVGLMLLGGLLGLSGVGLPHVETGIALSVLVLGGVLLFARHLPTPAGMALVGFFAVFHGHAHGSEMAAGMSVALYFAGFAVGTLSLHLAGFACGHLLQSKAATWWPGMIGASTAGAGAMLLIGG
ncbi:MAG: urease accessory protein [Alteromonadaceae bacterium]|nr:urease accessory protein [Alteromonadaceae bacterium]